MKNIVKKQTGITLIALVVTIIILIILAGVSISMLVGENGIITQAQTAKTQTEQAALKEKLDLIALERELNGSISSITVEDETDVFLDMMGDKEITQEDIDFFNETLQSYGKQLTAINNVSDVQKIGTDENYPLDGLYVLLADVSMDGQNWTPIGTEEDPFTGVFNGNNKTINGLTLTNPEMNAGLFGVNSGSVKNVELTNTSITSAHTFVGGIAGQNNGLIENCHIQSGTISGTGNDNVQDVITGEIINGGSRVGGISGQNNDGGMIQNCTNTSAVTGEYRLVGGICGYSIGGDIINCENRGEINGTYQLGGIAGDSEGFNANNISYVRNCNNYGNIMQTTGTEHIQAQSGGIVGCNYQYSVIENCNNEGILTGQNGYLGGITGKNSYIIEQCKNSGQVNNTAEEQEKARDIGGIVIIDFIDMHKATYKKEVINILNEELKKDKRKTEVLGMTRLGLVELTRRRERDSIDKYYLSDCETCEGNSKVKSINSVLDDIEKEIIRISTHTSYNDIIIELDEDNFKLIKMKFMDIIEKICEKYEVKISLNANNKINCKKINIIYNS